MLNINEGHNKELMEQCQILKEYSLYVARVQKYAVQMELNEAVEQAITECIREGILSEFLSRNRAEVLKVSIFEYDQELEEKKYREAEYEHGRQDGILEGIETGRTAGIQEGICTMVRNLAKQNIPLQQIAEAAGVDEKTVREWIEAPAVKEKRE